MILQVFFRTLGYGIWIYSGVILLRINAIDDIFAITHYVLSVIIRLVWGFGEFFVTFTDFAFIPEFC